ncbi:MAG: DMT family transporter [Lysobacteraceae bacterium]
MHRSDPPNAPSAEAMDAVVDTAMTEAVVADLPASREHPPAPPSSRHQASGQWRRGLMLALATAGFWATLPMALKFSLNQLDAFTLTWFRFLVATVLLGGWLLLRGELGVLKGLPRSAWQLLALAALMLTGNFVFYLLGVQYTTPGNAQLIIQLAPLCMAVGGIVIFRERFAAWQWLGLALIMTGLAVFFRDQLLQAAHGGSHYLLGTAFIVLAALVWAVYALAQKQLLSRLRSNVVLVFIYAVATGLLLPFTHPMALLKLDGVHWLVLGYCALNTLGAYGAFAEALAHWEASRVSAVLALTPLLCIGAIALVHMLWPSAIAIENIGTIGWVGAVLAVLGSMTVSLAGRRCT